MNFVNLQPVRYQSIGVVRSPFKMPTGTPIQAISGYGVTGQIELEPALRDGLRDLEEFSHLWLLCHLHEVTSSPLEVIPFLDTFPHGIFATRSPTRPNPISLSLVRLERVEISADGVRLHISDLDLLDGTPVLDIKPCVPQFDARDTAAHRPVHASSRS